MDQWLNDGPGVGSTTNDLCTGQYQSEEGELISWTDDPAGIASLSLWVLQYKATVKEADRSTDNRVLKAGGRRPKRISPRGATRDSHPALG